MENILEHYSINKKTIAILPAYQIEYESIVMEVEQTYYVKQSPFQLIQTNCLLNGASYDGRRAAVNFLTGYSRLVPIPINLSDDIYVFPTHSPQNDKCSWIFFNHIRQIQKSKNKNESIIHFKNNEQLTVDVSYHILSKQNFRVFMCRQYLLDIPFTHQENST